MRSPLKVVATVAGLTAWVAMVLLLTGRWRPFAPVGPADIEADILAGISRDIRGIDSNADGVRDDIAAWIQERFVSDPVARLAFLQLAADYQQVLVSTGDLTASLSSLLRLSQSLNCVHAVGGQDATGHLLEFKALLLDSDVRVRAWLKAQQRWQEGGFGTDAAPSATDCRFPADSRTGL